MSFKMAAHSWSRWWKSLSQNGRPLPSSSSSQPVLLMKLSNTDRLAHRQRAPAYQHAQGHLALDFISEFIGQNLPGHRCLLWTSTCGALAMKDISSHGGPLLGCFLACSASFLPLLSRGAEQGLHHESYTLTPPWQTVTS